MDIICNNVCVFSLPPLKYTEYQRNISHSEIVFPSAKPLVIPGIGGDQFPDVFTEYTVSCFWLWLLWWKAW